MNTTEGKTMRITDKLEARKVTLYMETGFGFSKFEARALAVQVGPYAQYSAAVEVAWIGKGQRSPRAIVQTFRPTLLILEGHGHPDPAGALGEEITHNGVTTRRSRFTSCSPEWGKEFDAMIAEHIARTGAKVVADYRGHNPHGVAPAAPAAPEGRAA